MGGCRCTYRNCTVKTDGKTHMFHYPVFEKVRCHQWLLNAHRLEFLDLMVSQLKNRVVCQNHFKDENFMNFRKDKLTFDAIPTEDGPYCDSTKYVKSNPEPSKLFSIIIENIENDYGDKKANYSLKYGDFLANIEVIDIEKIGEDHISYKNTHNNNVDILIPHKGRDKSGTFNEDGSFSFNISLHDEKNIKPQTVALSPYMSGADINDVDTYLKTKSKGKGISGVSEHNAAVIKAGTNLTPKQRQRQIQKVQQHIQQQLQQKKKQQQLQQKIQHQLQQERIQQQQLEQQLQQQHQQRLQQQQQEQLRQQQQEQLLKQQQQEQQQQQLQYLQEQEQLQYQQQLKLQQQQQHCQQQQLQKNETKVKILSEKKVTNPVTVTGKFELVTPNYVLNVSKRKDKLKNTHNNISMPTENEESSLEDKKIEIEIPPLSKEEDDPKLEQSITSEKLPHDSYLSENSPIVSVIKSRVPPERVEAINKKREFNMKLRDMVESCLEKLDNYNQTEQNKAPRNTRTKEKKINNQQGKSLLKQAPIVNPQEYTIAFLEARIRKMENTLLEKIEQNSMKIIDLKKTFGNSSSEQLLQSRADEEAHKRQLFLDISKYLSPSSKSLIYEELFINKFALNEPPKSPKRKRRRR